MAENDGHPIPSDERRQERAQRVFVSLQLNARPHLRGKLGMAGKKKNSGRQGYDVQGSRASKKGSPAALLMIWLVDRV